MQTNIYKLIFITFPFIVINSFGFSQNIMIGSGLENERLIVRAYQDTIFNKVVTSQDDRDIFISIPIKRKNNLYEFIIEDESVSSIFIDRKHINKKTLIYVDFNRSEFNGKKYLLSVSYKIMSKTVLDR